jgi:hypothetical protein
MVVTETSYFQPYDAWLTLPFNNACFFLILAQALFFEAGRCATE